MWPTPTFGGWEYDEVISQVEEGVDMGVCAKFGRLALTSGADVVSGLY